MVDVLVIFLFLIGAYYLAISVFSFVPQHKRVYDDKMRSFTVVIPAHNEEKVISGILSSIKNANYPKKLIRILVVADGCTDRTAEIADKLGAIVIEKDLPTCKGDALEYAFSEAQKAGVESDCVIVFDADNLVDPNFFLEINDRFSCGALAVQGYIDSKNPYDSWVAHAHSMWYWITNRIVQMGRANTGIGCRLGGTGFGVRYDVLSKIPWHTETIAEDSEYTCILAEHNIKIDFASRAVVYDEKPESFIASVGQRRRWTRGIEDVQGEYTMRLLKKGKINAVLGLWNDVLSPLVFSLLLIVTVFEIGGIAKSIAGSAVLYLYICMSFLTICLALILDKKMNCKIILNIFGFFVYVISWIPIGVSGLFSVNNQWYHTRHKG